MTTIEERVVSMKFQGEQFLAGIDKSLQKLEQFNQKMKMSEGTKGLEGVGAAAQRQSTHLSKLAENVQHISDRFKTMGVVGMAALSNITNQAVFAGQNLVKSLTVEPIMQGFREYELNMNSIQTILANTQASGVKLKDVTNILDELNHYSDQTIYNFAEMAKNIGTFTAAGVGLKPAASAIKGIANLAALSGSNSQQASGAMYQLSQAISSGRVSLEDWNSVVNAGMGGTVFQRALALTAEKMGTLDKGAVKLKGAMKNVSIEGKSFRESITAKPGQESWLTSEVLTKTLAQFTGDLKDAELAAMGFDKAQIRAIQAQAATAKAAATEVKTLSQLMGTLKESAGSGWSQTWKTIFGDFPEAKTLFTNVSNSIGGFIGASADARNKVLADWKALGGRTALINAISNSFNALLAVVKPIRDAFRQIFPATTGKQLADMSKSIERFTQNLKIGGTTANNLKRTFAGFFAVVDIGWMILKEFTKTILGLLGVATDGSGGFLEFTGRVGDFAVRMRDAVKNGEGLRTFFQGLGKVLAVPIKLIKGIVGFIGMLAGKAADIDVNLSPLAKIGTLASTAWDKVASILTVVWGKMQTFGRWVNGFFSKLGVDISSMLSNIDFKDVLAGVNTGIFAAIALMLRNLIGGGGAGGILDTISDGFENITGALGAMQNTLRAATLLQIAAAVLILAVAMDKLSRIDQEGLIRSGAAITYIFTNLMGAMLIFEKFSSFTGFAKMPFVAASMILLAVAVNVLASAVEKLSSLDWEELAKGLTGTTVLLGSLVAVSQLMGNPGRMISTGLGLLVLAAGIKVLVSAVSDLSGLSWEDLSKGLIGVGAILASLGLFTKFADANKGGILQGAGLLLLAAGIKILASAVSDMAGLSWDEIGRGLTTMAGAMAIAVASLMLIPPTAPLAAAGVLIVALSLGKVADALQELGSMSWGAIAKGLTTMLGAMAIIAAALFVIPPTAILSAAGVLIVAMSLGMIGSALQKFSEFSWEEIGKAMTVLAGSLAIIAVAMAAMTGALPGAAALLIVAASLAVLTPILTTLGAMSWEEILKGLTALAGAFTVIGLAGLLLTPVIPSLLGLGAAITLIGAGLALAGAGVFLFATGLTLLAASGVAAASAIGAMATILLGAMPQIHALIAGLLLALATLIIKAAPVLGQAFMVVMGTLITVIGNLSPKIVDLILKLLTTLYNSLAKYVPRMADAGARLITGILNGIAKRIGGIVTAATNLVVAFLNAIGNNAPRIADAGAKMIIKLVNGVANAIRANTSAMHAAGRNLAVAIIDGMTGGLGSGVGQIASKARDVAQSALNAAKNVLGINSPSKEFEKIGKFVNDGFRKGLDGNKGQVDAAFNSLKGQLSTAMKESAKDVDALEKKLKKLYNARRRDKDAINETKAALAQARKENKASSAAYAELTRKLNDETSALGRLATQQDAIAAKLEKANETLANAIKTRDDYNTQVREQYSDMAAPTGEQSAGDYITNLQKQVEDTKAFANQLQQLRALGLNDETYKDLLSTGISALPFVTDLIKGGKSQINQVNALNNELDSLGTSMGKFTSSALYQAAADSAAGIVKGLQNQQAAIEKQMDKIADAMVKAIKKKLGIKSPSRVFAEVGAYSARGLSMGLEKNAPMVADMASSVGDKAVEAMRISLSNLDKMVAGNIDVQPTIRPVLDLTDIRTNAGKIGSLLPSDRKMVLNGAYSLASAVATEVRNRRDADDSDAATESGISLSYTQNIHSPKAVSAVEVYRGTKNQLSTVKGALST